MKEREVSLGAALSAQIEILRAMVEVAQREQQHLLAVEADQIHTCVAQRKTLLERLDGANCTTEEAVNALRETLGLSEKQAPTISRLFKRLEPAYREHLHERCGCLESLAQALGELNAINMVHAQRGLRVVRSFSALLANNGHVQASDAYTKNGRAAQSKHTPGWLARSV